MINIWIFVFKPIAAIAAMIRNLPAQAKRLVMSNGTKDELLITAAKRKPRMNQGNTFAKSNLFAFLLPREKIIASANVTGTIIRLRVNFTMVAKLPAASL